MQSVSAKSIVDDVSNPFWSTSTSAFDEIECPVA